jgi:hypothetical protein
MFDPNSTHHRCRNPRCKTWLKEPVVNRRDAFCCRGCHARYFRTRCRVCEGPVEQPAHGTRLICNKAKCKNAWRAGLGFGRYHNSNRAKPSSEVPVNAESGGLDDLGLYPSPTFAESPLEVPVNKGPKVAINGDRRSPVEVLGGGPRWSDGIDRGSPPVRRQHGSDGPRQETTGAVDRYRKSPFRNFRPVDSR